MLNFSNLTWVAREIFIKNHEETNSIITLNDYIKNLITSKSLFHGNTSRAHIKDKF